jgi:hypothetical protein
MNSENSSIFHFFAKKLMMEKITLLVNAPKNFASNILRLKLDNLVASDQTDVLLISYHNKIKNTADFPVFSIEEDEDPSFSQLLSSISTDKFMFFNPEIDYPANFFSQILSTDEKKPERENGSLWTESLIAVQQSHYGLCGFQAKTSNEDNFLKESALFEKKEVETLNTDKLSVHPESSIELYRYAVKKKLNLVEYSSRKVKVEYLTNFTELMYACQKQAQKEFKLFPALFVLFFLFFGVGAAFNPALFLIFLLGMSAYLLAITLEAFGLSTIKKNGAILIVLLFLFPFVHLVYGLESLMAKFKKKA